MTKNKYIPPNILEFIANFKRNREKSVNDIFLNGNCFHFALILSKLYSKGTIVYSCKQGHFVYKYKNKYYDITGEAKVELPIVKFGKKMNEYNDFLRDCVYKENYYQYGRTV